MKLTLRSIAALTALSMFFSFIWQKPTETKTELSLDEIFSECVKESVSYTEAEEFAPDGEYTGIRAITFDGFSINNKKTKIFAYVAFPENADETTPGVVLVHGGGGHAYLEWVKQWLDQGYSVIAPDVTGYFPAEKNAGSSTSDGLWTHSLNGVFAEDGYTVIPDNDGMAHSSSPLEEQWMYHAIGAVIRSFSCLAESGKVSPDKIGTVGISWGSVIDSIYIGYDSRCAFAVSIYGSAYLCDALSYMKNMFAQENTRALWSAEDRLCKVSCPVLWLCSDIDGNFSLNSNSESFAATQSNKGTRIAIISSFAHSHEPAWERKEPFTFADSIVKHGNGLPGFVTYPTGESLSCEVTGASRARLYYITEEMSYSLTDADNPLSTMPDQTWKKANIDFEDGKIDGEIPADAVMYYISVTGDGNTVSTPVVKVEK